MAYTTIDKGEEYFNTVLWTGDASSDKSISGVGFQPDWVWAKNRSDSNDHQMIDSNRGAGKILRPNSDGAELTRSSDVGAGGLQNFESDGFDVHSTTSNTNLNDNGELNVGWCWKANGGTTTTNDASATGVGTIDSVYQANTTAGFSIVTYTGTGSAGTIAHGLGVKPKLYIIKNRERSDSWRVATEEIGYEKQLLLGASGTDAEASDSNTFNNTAPTSTVFSVGTRNATNANGENHVAYVFAEIKGYSKFGSYRGNITSGSEGMFVYTGFKPAWLMVKSNSNSGQEWVIFDNTRDPFNVADAWLYAQATTVEDSGGAERDVDFLSNGFKFRNAGGPTTYDGRTYIYLAFAEHPFVSSKGVPVTAR